MAITNPIDPNAGEGRVKRNFQRLAHMLNGGVAGTGTVTSVALSLPASVFSVTGSPVTSSGTLTATLVTDAIDALLPSQATNAGKFLKTDGTHTSWATAGGTTSPLTTKGDIWVYSTTDTRLPVSATDRKFLLSDSSQATGLRWGFVLAAKGDLFTNDGTQDIGQAVGANGTVLVADSTQSTGIKWAAPSAVGSGGMMDVTFPIGSGGAGSTQTLATNVRAYYLGKATRAYTSVDVVWHVVTVGSSITWAEVAICSGSFVPNAGTTLTTRGFTSVAATIAAGTVNKVTTVAVSGIAAGDELWVVFGSVQTGTTPILESFALSSSLQYGQSVAAANASVRPSTMAANTAFGLNSGDGNIIAAIVKFT